VVTRSRGENAIRRNLRRRAQSKMDVLQVGFLRICMRAHPSESSVSSIARSTASID
jgi:hypothetical protein